MLVKVLKDFSYRKNPGNKLVIAKKGEEVEVAGCEYLSLSKEGYCKPKEKKSPKKKQGSE